MAALVASIAVKPHRQADDLSLGETE